MNFINRKKYYIVLLIIFSFFSIFLVNAKTIINNNSQEELTIVIKDKINSLTFFDKIVKFDKNTQLSIYNKVIIKINILIRKNRNNSTNKFVLNILKDVIIEKIAELNFPPSTNPPSSEMPPNNDIIIDDGSALKDILFIQPSYNLQHVLSSDFYGFNEGLYAGNFGFKDKEYLDRLKELSPKSERFPGGTISNYFHWKTGNIDRDEVSGLNDMTPKGSLLSNDTMLSKTEGSLKFDDFIYASNVVGSNKYIVLNLYTGTPEESASWAQYIKDKGYTIAGWELGNELYMKKYQDKFPNVKEYVKIAKEHIAAIKKILPDSKFGIVAAPHSTISNPDEYKLEWNSYIAKETFYDAYILHNYFGFPENKEMSTAELADYTFYMSNSSLNNRMKYYKSLFNMKDIWMTEWNFMGFEYTVPNNTHMNALYVSDFFTQLLKYPEIKVGMYHTLAPFGRWPGLFFDVSFIKKYLKGHGNIELPSDCSIDTRCVLNTNILYPFLIISKAIKNSKYVIPLNISREDIKKFNFYYEGTTYNLDYPLLKLIGLGDTSNNVNKILATNLKDKNIALNIDKVLGGNVSDVNLECITNDTLDSKENNSLLLKDNVTSKYIKNYTFKSNEIILPKYSFCSINL